MPRSAPPPVDAGSPGPGTLPRPEGGLPHPLPAGMRDLLPTEARQQRALTGSVIDSFLHYGYDVVYVPPFEYADVLEHEVGRDDSGRMLRFVEPETGEVVALRPDMTPQVARLVATRLAEAPRPLRLCYEGAVVRRRAERARRDRQIQQAGIELIGLGGAEGDLEVISVAMAAMRAAGLENFTVDLGHAMISASLLEAIAPEARAEVTEALSRKDSASVRRVAARAGLDGKALAALSELPTLYGSMQVWSRAERLLEDTPAAAPARELEALAGDLLNAEIAPKLVVDLGETWNFFYYTGAIFRILADGPGEPVASGGRYDRLFDRFGMSAPAAGFAVDLGNLSWALERCGESVRKPTRLLIGGGASPKGSVTEMARALRARGLACATAPGGDPETYARAWDYSHLLLLTKGGADLVSLGPGTTVRLDGASAAELVRQVEQHLGVPEQP